MSESEYRDVRDYLMQAKVEPICGWDWLRQHKNDLDDWVPIVEISGPGLRQTMEIRAKKALKAVADIIWGMVRRQ